MIKRRSHATHGRTTQQSSLPADFVEPQFRATFAALTGLTGPIFPVSAYDFRPSHFERAGAISMDAIDINTLTPEQVRTILPILEGITPDVANGLADWMETNNRPFTSKMELLELLTELGVGPASTEKLGQVLKAEGDDAFPVDEPYDFDFILNPEMFFDIGGKDGFRDDDIEKLPKTPDKPQWWGETIFPENNRPLVVVPGIMGSRLVSISRGHPRLRWPPINADGIDILKQLPDQIRYGQLRAGVGDTLGAYEGLLSALNDKGYSAANNNLLFFTYNWTQSNALSGAQLTTAIAAFLKRFNLLFGTTHDSVDVIAHSMGGLVTRVAIGNGSPVRRTAYVATPHYGSPKAYFALHPDIDNVGFWAEAAFDLFNWTFDRDEFDDLDEALHKLAQVCDSVYELLPNKFYLDNIKMLRLESKGGTEKYLSGTRKTYFQNKYRIPHGMDRRARLGLRFSENLGPTPPGDHLLIVGPNLSTTDQVEFNFDFFGKDEFDSPEASARRGDGTVPTYSACAAAGSSRHRFITDVSHTMLPNDAGVLRLLERYMDL
jgi:triacylglycerol esterase/lipase EstA (alpha/beta hydrolase family)